MKIKRLLSVVLSISIVFTAFTILSSVASLADDNVIEVSTVDEIIQLVNNNTYPYYKGKTIKMTADITMPDNWTPFEYFGGIFDGQGYTLTINMNVDGKGSPVFGFCRYMMDGAVINTHFSGSITTTTDNACLIDAMWCNSVIANCINDMTISGKDCASGYANDASGNDNIVAGNNIFIGSVASSSGNSCPMFNQTNSANANLKMVNNFSTIASSSNSFGFEVKDVEAMKTLDFFDSLNNNRSAIEAEIKRLCGKDIDGQLLQWHPDSDGLPCLKELEYDITVENLLGFGTIDVQSNAKAGETVTGKISPTKNYSYTFGTEAMDPVDFAYYDGSLMINNVRTGTTTVNPDGTVDFSFVMPESNVTLFAEFINTNYVYDDCDISDNNGTAVDYKGPGGVVVVPGRIKTIDTSTQLFYKNNTITSLIFEDGVETFSAMSTCSEMTELRHVELADSINYLSGAELEGGGCSFYGCTKLVDAKLAGGITTIPFGTFMVTPQLKSVVLPEGVQRLAKGQFTSSGVTEVVLPSTVTYVGEFVFGRMWGGNYPAFEKCVVLGKDTELIVGTESGNRSTPFYVDGSSNVVNTTVYAEKGSKAESFVRNEATYFNDKYNLSFKEISEIHFETNGGSLVSPIWGTVEDASSEEGVAVTAPVAPSKEGYTFGGWYTDEELTTAYTFDKLPQESITLYAKWEFNHDVNGDGVINIKDLVHLKKIIVSQVYEDNISSKNLVILRKKLLGLL